ncbi:MAG: RHS repeat-associated core domain-containing protein [Prevotellaceae bacterium]|jgi:RHS repeat-associated protein|nr:RHS repeat-associated core domain-containing protein [Prevotellaceae bacterium]
MVLNASAAVQQANDYFPFGLTHATVANIAKNKYLYNGKELQNDVLAGIAFDQLDYGARFYDPVIGRWHAVDPMAEKYFSFSPYIYCSNNPIRFIDPTGMVPDSLQEKDKNEDGYIFSERFGWVTEQFYAFLIQGGYKYNDDKQVRDLFYASVGITNGEEEIFNTSNEGPFYTPSQVVDLLEERAMNLVGAAGSVMPFVPIVGSVYEHTSNQISGIESNIIANLGEDVLALTLVNYLPTVKFLKTSGGKIAGFTVSRGSGYGAKSRFDIHKLMYPSKKNNSFSSWVKGKTLPHYHRGKGNNLRRHRPWEKGSNDKNFFNRF